MASDKLRYWGQSRLPGCPPGLLSLTQLRHWAGPTTTLWMQVS